MSVPDHVRMSSEMNIRAHDVDTDIMKVSMSRVNDFILICDTEESMNKSDRPTTKRLLNMEEPTMEPNPMLFFVKKTSVREVSNSGVEEPIDNSVAPDTDGGSLKIKHIFTRNGLRKSSHTKYVKVNETSSMNM